MPNKLPFQHYHLFQALKFYESQQLPLDVGLHNYFKKNKALGSKDRAFIAETIYGMVRWLGLIDYLAKGEKNWEIRFRCYQNLNLELIEKSVHIPPHVKVSFPQELYALFESSYDHETQKLCLDCNKQAPTTIRINPIKTTREALFEKWRHQFDIQLTTHSPFGIQFLKKQALFALPEFKEGLFELQDEASQNLALLIQPSPGQRILDFCSGSGGKTLAFAHLTEGKGQIYLHDVRKSALEQAKKRLKRAGIQNAQFLLENSSALQVLKQKMDWVLVDAPCSGTGTLRRNPDMKWKFKRDDFFQLVGKQRHIFEKALSYLKKGGIIVYATCSVLKEENEEQVAHFLKTYPLQQIGPIFKTLPKENGPDGFFAVCFSKK